MSQIYKTLTSGGPIPPIIATSYVTDDGTAIPAANILNVNALDSSENVANGIITRANPDLSNNLEVVVTNRVQGTGTTTTTGTSDIITFPLGATPGSYSFEIRASGYSTTALGTAYSIFFCIKTDGATANIPDTPDEIYNEDAGLGGSDLEPLASGNNFILRATGVAGMNINWVAVGLYTFAS